MVIKVGVNGFGRIGRIVSRACLQNPDIQLAAINDPAISVEYVSYLIKFDSTHGKLNGVITYSDDEIVVDGHHIKVFHEKLPPRIPWHSVGVQYVVEASGMFTNYEKSSGHLESNGVKRVVVTAPSTDIPMIILGVNDSYLSPEEKVVSCASSTLYCLAPIIKVLEDNFGVVEGFITSIHAMTPSLKPLDGLCLRGRHWRDHRSVHQNIIPASTGACKALGKILPQVKDKLSGLAFRVPIVNVSVLDLTVRLQTNTTMQEVVKHVQQASKTTLKNIIKVSNEESVSSDFNGESISCVFDEYSSLQHKPNFFKFVCWYENEYSYACRVVDTILFSENQIHEIFNERALKREMCNVCTLVCNLERAPEIASNVFKDSEVKVRSSYALFAQKQTVAGPALKLHEDTKMDELFKTWKDNNEKSKSTAPTPFFQPCVGIGITPQPKKIECHTQARLENVKREFTKMVSITEDLLKKTYSNQSNGKSKSIDAIKRCNENKTKLNVDKEKTESSTQCEKCGDSPVEDCGYSKSSERSVNSQTGNEKSIKDDEESLMSCEKTRSEYSDCNSFYARDFKKLDDATETKTEFIGDGENKESLTNIETDRYFKKIMKSSQNTKFKQLIKTKSNLLNRLSPNKQVKCVWNNLKVKPFVDIDKTKLNKTSKNGNTFVPTPNFKHLPFEKKETDIPKIDQIQNFENNFGNSFIINNFKSITERSNIKIIDDELKKRNIILVDSPFVAEVENEISNEEHKIAETDIKYKATRISKHELEELAFNPETVLEKIPNSNESLKCTTPNNEIATSSRVYENRQDIYDKLDSASESNSNNSFEIKERKSQVIQITDLTNSLEDLARLDKICRIIEISDELSDKLFSALDDNNYSELKKKRWSFKDLCARIKLDEFCNKVFGGTS